MSPWFIGSLDSLTDSLDLSAPRSTRTRSTCLIIRHNADGSKRATYSYTVIEGLPKHSGEATQVPLGSPAYKAKALRRESNSPDIGISSFYYLLQSSLFEGPPERAGRPKKPTHNSGRGRPHKTSVPSFAARQARIDEVCGANLPEIVRVAEGRLPDEVDDGDVL